MTAGVVSGAGLHALPAGTTVPDLVRAGLPGRRSRRGRWRWPVPRSRWTPTFCVTNPYAMVGAHDDVPVPPGSTPFDVELEVVIGVVPGRDGASLTPLRRPRGPRCRPATPARGSGR